MNISKTIRQDILDIISINAGSWYGELDDIEFLERIFDLDSLPSYDSRFSTAREDIFQHRINNNDWEDEWIFRDNRFNIIGTDDNTFFRFICEVIHPRVRSNEEQVQILLTSFNQQLYKAGYELVVRTRISGKPVFESKRLRGARSLENKDLSIFFYTTQWRKYSTWMDYLPKDIKYPCVVLLVDNWDDFGYKTAYQLSYLEGPKKQVFSGSIKILENGKRSTEIPNQFTALGSQFCSLGQTQEFYTNIKDLGTEIYTKILVSINDVVFNPEIGKKFEDVPGFQISLLRFSEAEKAYHEGNSLFSGKVRSRRFKFEFSTSVAGAGSPHTIDFDFSPDQSELHRVSAIIGKNGTGKTQVLANFAQAMSGLRNNVGSFSPAKPSFSKVIALSYSVFDEFEKPPEGTDTFSYKYCGVKTKNDSLTEEELGKIRTLIQNTSLNQEQFAAMQKAIALFETGRNDTERLLSPHDIREQIQKTLTIVKKRNFDERLLKILETLLGRQLGANEVWSETGQVNSDFYNTLSSGQRILVLILSEVIAHIVEESIILFDEPEIHLHPEALSALARAFHLLLEEFDSYAIIATHSPIVLQEIPSRYVTVFDREGNFPVISKLSVESFGENFTVITEDVFHTSTSRNNYRDHLDKLSKKYSLEEVLEIFDNQLGFNARSFLSALYSEK
jgi:predicted ATPase